MKDVGDCIEPLIKEVEQLRKKNKQLEAVLKRAYEVILAEEYWDECLPNPCPDDCNYPAVSCDFCKKKYIAKGA